jgi:hypothetical protein
MKSVDLRSNYEQVYHQGQDPSCGPFAVANALDCIWERATGRQTRFDPYHLWDWSRWHRGLAGVSTGSTFDSLERATRLNGMKLGNEVLMGFQLVRTNVSDRSYAEVKRLLCFGVPVVMEIKVTPDVDNLTGPWRTHQISTDTSVTRGQHYVSIVGYDDDAGRFLAENSWGAGWGDDGFFGIPYDRMPMLTESLQHFNQAPIHPKPVEGYTVTVPILLTADRAAFTDRAAPALLRHLMDAFGTGGAQALIAECKAWGVSDKHLEALAGWPRGSVRAFQADNPGLDWTGFVFDQL